MPAFNAKAKAKPKAKPKPSGFAYARRAENAYGRALRSVANQINAIVRGFELADGEELVNAADIEATLREYAHLIEPWARAVAARMLGEVERRDYKAWSNVAERMRRNLRYEIKNAPTGEMLQRHLASQVDLITSLPLEAAERVHTLTLENIQTGTRAKELAEDIYATGHVAKSRAMLIARTETARTASALVQARAQHIGSEGYIWRTVGDKDVRNVDGNPIGSHRKLNGKFIRWDSPPVASTNGVRAHAGQIYNCRCWPEPVVPEEPE